MSAPWETDPVCCICGAVLTCEHLVVPKPLVYPLGVFVTSMAKFTSAELAEAAERAGFNRYRTCGLCQGSGSHQAAVADRDPSYPCDACKGTGRVPVRHPEELRNDGG